MLAFYALRTNNAPETESNLKQEYLGGAISAISYTSAINLYVLCGWTEILGKSCMLIRWNWVLGSVLCCFQVFYITVSCKSIQNVSIPHGIIIRNSYQSKISQNRTSYNNASMYKTTDQFWWRRFCSEALVYCVLETANVCAEGWDSTVQYSTVQYSTVQYSTVQYGTVRYSTVQYSTVQYTVQYSTVRYGTVQYGTVRYGTVQYSTVRYGTVRYGTVRYST
jgi:hypothetical protein